MARLHCFPFYKKEVEPLLTAGGKSDTEIIEAVTPALNDLLGRLRKTCRATLTTRNFVAWEGGHSGPGAGEDDELLVGNLIDKNPFTVDSFDEEPANFFIDYNNQLIKRGKGRKGKDVHVVSCRLWIQTKVPTRWEMDIRIATSFAYGGDEPVLRQHSGGHGLHPPEGGEEQKAGTANCQCGREWKVLDQWGRRGKGTSIAARRERNTTEEDYYPHVLEKEDSSIDLRPISPASREPRTTGGLQLYLPSFHFEYILKKSTQQEEDLRSERFVYYNVRKEQGDVNTDKGSSIADVVKSYGEYGVWQEELFKYDDKDLVVAPTEDAVADAETRKIVKAKTWRLRTISPNRWLSSRLLPMAISSGVVCGLRLVQPYGSRWFRQSSVVRWGDSLHRKAESYHGYLWLLWRTEGVHCPQLVEQPDWGDKGYCIFLIRMWW